MEVKIAYLMRCINSLNVVDDNIIDLIMNFSSTSTCSFKPIIYVIAININFADCTARKWRDEKTNCSQSPSSYAATAKYKSS